MATLPSVFSKLEGPGGWGFDMGTPKIPTVETEKEFGPCSTQHVILHGGMLLRLPSIRGISMHLAFTYFRYSVHHLTGA